MLIRSATAGDVDDIRHVVALAFGRADEADLVDQLRADGDVRVEQVAVEHGRVIGHILFSRLPLIGEHDVLDGLALAPVSVLPERQNAAIGSSLINNGVSACRALGAAAIVVLGHQGYYPRFGFDARLAKGLAAPFSGPSFMAMELETGALATPRRVVYASAFGLDQVEGSNASQT